MVVEEPHLASCIVPPGVACGEVEDAGQSLPLHPEEEIHVAGAADIRRRDFAAGRIAARAALARLGVQDVVIGRAVDGLPIWPAGMVGSITHTKGYAAALVACGNEFLGIGVDAERAGRLTDAMMPLLFGAQEQDWLDSLSAAGRSFAATILFSAKEAYFKAFSPLTGQKLSFRALSVTLDDEGFAVTQPDSGLDAWKRPVRGRLAMQGDLVVTAVCLPRPG